ncbi:hypothetical protein KY359_00905 [Candidatus Woesearchaeota archaeon]|nr:hypothetical protein [Candidatus Woesearchaeota archaeon]
MKKGKGPGLSLKTTTALIIIIFILGAGAAAWYYALYKVVDMHIFDIEILVSEDRMLGFNADPTLHFGKIPMTGGLGKKYMNIHNDWDIPLLLNIRIRGDAAQFISVDDNNFILQPDEYRKITFYARIPDNFNHTGNFTGEAKVTYFRP